MWLFLSRRLRTWVLLALGMPVASWLFGRLGERLEARRGPTRVSRALRWVGRRAERRSRGPLTRHAPPAA